MIINLNGSITLDGDGGLIDRLLDQSHQCQDELEKLDRKFNKAHDEKKVVAISEQIMACRRRFLLTESIYKKATRMLAGPWDNRN